MNPTEAATRMNLQGAYTLCVAETCIALCKPRQLTPALTWNLKCVPNLRITYVLRFNLCPAGTIYTGLDTNGCHQFALFQI